MWTAMREFELDATNWTTVHDFYDALFSAIGAPEWHGRNINALIDSMIWGGINKVDPPYIIHIKGVGQLSKGVRDHIELAKNALQEAHADFRVRRGHDIEVQLETYAHSRRHQESNAFTLKR
jgi:hypothetical protein